LSARKRILGFEGQPKGALEIAKLLGNCRDFRTEKTQLQYILGELGALLRLSPKCHPEVAGIGIEYAWGYAKLIFRTKINDGQAANSFLAHLSFSN